MNSNWFVVGIAVGALVLTGIPYVTAQSGRAAGPWQLVVAGAGDGGNAWRINTDTGESHFCYRQNCYALPLPTR